MIEDNEAGARCKVPYPSFPAALPSLQLVKQYIMAVEGFTQPFSLTEVS